MDEHLSDRAELRIRSGRPIPKGLMLETAFKQRPVLRAGGGAQVAPDTPTITGMKQI
jgi:hypothetical protein